MYIESYSLNKYDCDIEEFNSFFQNKNLSFSDSLKLQAKLVKEEADELFEASQTNNYEHIIKEICDVLYVALRYVQLMEYKGFRVREAMRLVAENNMSKFIKDDANSTHNIKKSLRMYADKKIPAYAELNAVRGYWSIKNSDGKMLKPYDYQSVNLTSCVPDMFKGENDD